MRNLVAVVVVSMMSIAGCGGAPRDKSQDSNEVSKTDEPATPTAHQRWIDSVSSDTRAEDDFLAYLKARYGDIATMKTGAGADRARVARFTRLMREWNPLQFKARDIEGIAGPPTKKSPQALLYWFVPWETASAMGWEFTLDGDVIVGVRYIMGP